MTLAPLGFDLVGLLGISDRFASLAVEWIQEGLATSELAVLEEGTEAGLGEALVMAFYKATVLRPDQPELVQAVTDLLLRYRFRCALDGLVDHRGQALWFTHGLDREVEEAQWLHRQAGQPESQHLEWLCFGRHLANYFGAVQECPDPQAAHNVRRFSHLEPVGGHLWQFRGPEAGSPLGRRAYLVAPQPWVGIVGAGGLCKLVGDLMPELAQWQSDPQQVLCLPLGSRKASISKQGVHSCSTYFVGGKPVPFSLNRGIEPYLLISGEVLTAVSDLRTKQLCFAPLLDSMSTLVFRDPADYRLGGRAFLNQPLSIPARQSLFRAGRGAATRLSMTPGQCLVEGLLLQTKGACLSLTPCHDLADRYARHQGLSGHGPSGVMNQSAVITGQGIFTTWRYERNFDSWSGRCADVARHPSLNFLAWDRRAFGATTPGADWTIRPLTYSGYPSECKVEDLRLFTAGERIYAISALILSKSRYSNWLPEVSAEAAANNTIDDMIVVQAIGEIDAHSAELRFSHLPVLQGRLNAKDESLKLPTGFEKNWLIHCGKGAISLLYSIQPWVVFQGDLNFKQWHLGLHQPIPLPQSIQGPLRNSAHPFRLSNDETGGRLGLVVHRRRQKTYIYDQFLMVLSEKTMLPLRISRQPILSVDPEAVGMDLGFRKNSGVCYISSVVEINGHMAFLFNLFDCRTCVLEVRTDELNALVDDDTYFAPLVP